MTITALCRQLGITRSAYYRRVRRGWDRGEAASLPKGQRKSMSRPDVSRVLREWRR